MNYPTNQDLGSPDWYNSSKYNIMYINRQNKEWDNLKVIKKTLLNYTTKVNTLLNNNLTLLKLLQESIQGD